MEIVERHIVAVLDEPRRLKEYAVGHFVGAMTRSAFKKAIKKGLVTVNGIAANTATFVHGNEEVCLRLPEQRSDGRELIFDLQVLFEDEHLAVVHKPAGILVSGNRFVTVARALPQNLRLSTQPDAAIPQPAHRLDYATTGSLLVGKTSNCIRALSKLFAEKKIEKVYYATTIGEMPGEGVVESNIDDKPSRTSYKVIRNVVSERFGQLNLVALSPSTGRRHQIRKHMASIGHQILGDKDYGDEHLILNGKGLYLHAYSLRFFHPITEKELYITDPLPKRFVKIFGDAV